MMKTIDWRIEFVAELASIVGLNVAAAAMLVYAAEKVVSNVLA